MSRYAAPIIILTLFFLPLIYQLGVVIKEYKNQNKQPLRKAKKILKIILIVIFSLGGLLLLLNHTNYLNYERPITYDRFNEITFKNFRGLELFKKSLYGNERFAYVVTSIDVDINEDEVIVESLFHPSRSFVYNTHSNSKELLTHELYHIKITELFARKIKSKIAETSIKSESDIQGIIKRLLLEEKKYQKQYDYDTFHSYVLSEQKKYQKEIDSLLHLFSEFQKKKVKINEKN